MYKLGPNPDVWLEFFPVRDVIRPSMIVVDYYRFAVDYGISTRICDMDEDQLARQKFRCFEVLGFKYTSPKI